MLILIRRPIKINKPRQQLSSELLGFRRKCKNSGLVLWDWFYFSPAWITALSEKGTEMHAGAFVKDSPVAALDIDAYRRSIDQIQFHGGTANGGTANGGTANSGTADGGTLIIFQSHGRIELEDDQIINAYQVLGEEIE